MALRHFALPGDASHLPAAVRRSRLGAGLPRQQHASHRTPYPASTLLTEPPTMVIEFKSAALTALSPAIVIHLFFALGALVLGPLALWARKGSGGHRGAGYAWVLLMVGTALSSLFIRDFRLPNLAGYTPIHILTFVSLVGIARGLWLVMRRRIGEHRRQMQGVFAGQVIAGAFTLLPGRYLGSLLWHHSLGLV
jgi:uncharacterized membrane protein